MILEIIGGSILVWLVLRRRRHNRLSDMEREEPYSPRNALYDRSSNLHAAYHEAEEDSYGSSSYHEEDDSGLTYPYGSDDAGFDFLTDSDDYMHDCYDDYMHDFDNDFHHDDDYDY